MSYKNKMKCLTHSICKYRVLRGEGHSKSVHFFLPPAAASSLRSHEMTFPSITTPLPSMNATRERPSQFLKVSHTRGCWGWKLHWAISFDFREWGSSIFFAPGLFAHLPLQFGDAAC